MTHPFFAASLPCPDIVVTLQLRSGFHDHLFLRTSLELNKIHALYVLHCVLIAKNMHYDIFS